MKYNVYLGLYNNGPKLAMSKFQRFIQANTLIFPLRSSHSVCFHFGASSCLGILFPRRSKKAEQFCADYVCALNRCTVTSVQIPGINTSYVTKPNISEAGKCTSPRVRIVNGTMSCMYFMWWNLLCFCRGSYLCRSHQPSDLFLKDCLDMLS